MEEKKEKSPSLGTCMVWGMLFGTVIGVAIDNIAAGIPLGFLLGMGYYGIFSKPKE